MSLTKFVDSSVVILFDLKHLKQDALKVLQRCFLGVSGRLKGVSS